MEKDSRSSNAKSARVSKTSRGGYAGSAPTQVPKRPTSPGAGTPATTSGGGESKSGK
jgi:hypothetical protein